MNHSSPNRLPRFYGGDLEPQGHAAAYIVILLVFGVIGVIVAQTSGWLTLPADLFSMERLRPTPLLALPTPTTAQIQAGAAPAAAPARSPLALAAADWDIPGGHFFTQTNGQDSLRAAEGYAVTNDEGVRFWDAYQDLGGVDRVGYPLSNRFSFAGMPTQVFQRAVFQWRRDTGQVEFANIFDELSRAGKDDWLSTERSVPPALEASFDDGKTWDETVRDRLALLDANPAFKAQYFSAPDPLQLYGLPNSQITDMGSHLALRLQRAVFQQWKTGTPWAKEGEVTVANAGAIAAEGGLFPTEALQAKAAPAGSAPLATGPIAPLSQQPPPAPAPAATFYTVGNTDGMGVYLRRTPRLDDKLLAWPDNARMEDMGETGQADGMDWRKVKDPAGNMGWIPAKYLVQVR